MDATIAAPIAIAAQGTRLNPLEGVKISAPIISPGGRDAMPSRLFPAALRLHHHTTVVSRFVTAVAIAAVIAAARPAIADGPVAPPTPAPVTPAAPGSRAAAPRVGTALLIIGGVLAATSTILLVNGYRHRNDINGDAAVAYGGYGLVIAAPAVLSLTVGLALAVPTDSGPGSSSPNSHPRFVQLPRGLMMRFTF
ncbi:MAG TPA: hypothetical protein VKQ32_02770 [Polyangia bacterium]|nr:hypothetical protein [Polyangia bacterium]